MSEEIDVMNMLLNEKNERLRRKYDMQYEWKKSHLRQFNITVSYMDDDLVRFCESLVQKKALSSYIRKLLIRELRGEDDGEK